MYVCAMRRGSVCRMIRMAREIGTPEAASIVARLCPRPMRIMCGGRWAVQAQHLPTIVLFAVESVFQAPGRTTPEWGGTARVPRLAATLNDVRETPQARRFWKLQ